MRKSLKGIVVVLLFVIPFCWTGCGREVQTDRADSDLRIISLSPNLTEIMFELGLEDEIVGVTDYCTFPSEATQKPHVGALRDPNFEVMISLRPTLMLGLPTHESIRDRIEQMGAELVIVNNETFQNVLDSIITIGGKTGKESEAEKLAEALKGKIDMLKEAASERTPKKTLIIIDRASGSLRQICAVGPDTFLDELITAAGGKNVIERSIARYPIISKETIIAANPEVIIETRSGIGLDEETREREREVWDELEFVSAVREKKVFIVDDPMLTIPGVHIPEQIELIATMIHSE